MTSYRGNSISWTSYNLPASIAAAGQTSQFWYGPNRNRWKQVASYPSGTETTIYVGGVLEKVTVPTGTGYRHYVGAGSAQVVYTRWSTGSENTRYLTADHLNSSSVLMDASGNTLVGMSFAAYGRRRGAAWTGAPSSGDWTQINNGTRHGFTGHEHLDNVNLIHMNGRVFEPVLGRFLSADPFMPGSLGSQAPNRYAYVGNRPLSLTDPSGFWPRNGNAKKQWMDKNGTLDQLEIAIYRGWLSWGGVRNVSDGIEGTHAGLMAHNWDLFSRGDTSPTVLSFIASTGSVGASLVAVEMAIGRSTRSNVSGNNQEAVPNADGTFTFTQDVSAPLSYARSYASSSRNAWVPGAYRPQGITPHQLRLASTGKYVEFWWDRRNVNDDPVAELALAIINDELGLGRMARNRLQEYISESDLDISLSQISAEIALAHAQSVMADMGDMIGIPGLLSPRQIAAYHHVVFESHGIPASVFGGTIGVPFVRVPASQGWVQPIFDASVYSVIWCGRCDSWP